MDFINDFEDYHIYKVLQNLSEEDLNDLILLGNDRILNIIKNYNIKTNHIQYKIAIISKEFGLPIPKLKRNCYLSPRKNKDKEYLEYKKLCEDFDKCNKIKNYQCIKKRIEFALNHTNDKCVDSGHALFIIKVYDLYKKCRDPDVIPLSDEEWWKEMSISDEEWWKEMSMSDEEWAKLHGLL